VLHDRGARGQQPLGIAVALSRGQVADHVDEDLLGSLEAERGRIADVQLDDPAAFLLEALCLLEYRPADVVADVRELAGLHQVHSEQR
jgi:hypothetical protein